MNFIKKLCNLIFGTRYPVDIEPYHKPSKSKLMRAALREYGAKDYWD
jgi:hypothetical protein